MDDDELRQRLTLPRDAEPWRPHVMAPCLVLPLIRDTHEYSGPGAFRFQPREDR
jgi:hypothetical protein